MAISEIDCGITEPHIKAIKDLMKQENTFLFVRPTEYDSTVLIKLNYATKSMDIHDKSSNWGPMAGMVPCDPAFSKKLVGTGNAAPNYAPHGKAHPVHLKLESSLYTTFLGTKIDEKQGYTLGPGDTVTKTQSVGPPNAQVKFCQAKGGGAGLKATVFCLKKAGLEWEVYWVHAPNPQAAGKLVRLFVWAYEVGGVKKPVTGDYDLWMVAPFWDKFGAHSVIDIKEDEHGKSAATNYITDLLGKMNQACGCANNPVIQHGAESQNYGFTQNLDKRLAMFTPAGDAFPISVEVLPNILSEIQSAGYLVYTNKRYGEIDPQISGKHWTQRTESAQRGLAAFVQYAMELKKLEDQGVNVTGTPAERKAAGQTGVGRARFRNAVRQVIARGDKDIRKFHNDLMDLMRAEIAELKVLTPSDFPSGYQLFQSDTRKMLQQLQASVVDSTSATGTGQSDHGALNKALEEWRAKWDERYT